jgi:hypothetical protein
MTKTAYHPSVIRRAFLALAVLLLGCGKDPSPRPLPSGHWWKKGAALRIDPKRVELVRRLDTERAPLIVEGSYESKMERDGSFTVTVKVDSLKRELVTRRGESAATDIHETLETATFDGEPITKGGVVALTLKLSEKDRVVDMCFVSTKKCTRLETETTDPVPPPSTTTSAPTRAPAAPFRAIPTGDWWTEDRARIELVISGTRLKLIEHVETERAPLTAEGPFKSTMERDGSFTVTLTVDTLEKKFLSRCLDCKSKDVWERLDNATFDGQPIAKGGAVELRITFSEDDRVAEMCLGSSKKCERMKRG